MLMGSVNVIGQRTTGGYFDSANFDATAGTISNRGWIDILCEA